MSRTIEDIAARDVSRILEEQGIAPEQKVTVVVDESLSDIAKRTRTKATARGMTEQIFEELMKAS